MKKIYFNQDAGAGGGSPAADGAGSESEKQIVVVDPEKEFQEAEAFNFDEEPGAASATDDDDKGGDGGASGADDSKKEAGADDAKKGDENTLKIEDTAGASDEVTTSWNDLAKEMGFKDELKEDSFEAFMESAKTYKEQIRQEVQSQAAAETLVSKYGEEGKVIFNLLENGKTYAEIIAPLKKYDDFLVRSPEDKLTAMYLQQNRSEEWIEKRLEQLKEDGEFDEEVNALNKTVLANREAEWNKIMHDSKNLQETTKNAILATQKKENEAIRSVVTQRETFNGMKIDPEAKKVIMQRWEAGHYRKAFESNPDAVVDFILNLEFGKKFAENAKATAEKQAKVAVHNKLHNIDQVKSGTRSAGADKGGAGKDADDQNPWSAWSAINSEKVVVNG